MTIPLDQCTTNSFVGVQYIMEKKGYGLSVWDTKLLHERKLKASM